MNPGKISVIVLMVFLLGEESLAHGGVGDHVREEEPSAQKRSLVPFKKGHHLFNNVGKCFTRIIEDVVFETHLKDFCFASKYGNKLEITDDKNKDVSGQLSSLVNAFKDYKTNPWLTTNRDQLFVSGEREEESDKNSEQWGKAILDLKGAAIKYIDLSIEAPFEKVPMENRIKLAESNVQQQTDRILNTKAYVDDVAMKRYLNENWGKKQDVENVEMHIREEIKHLALLIKLFGKEAATFYEKEFNKL